MILIQTSKSTWITFPAWKKKNHLWVLENWYLWLWEGILDIVPKEQGKTNILLLKGQFQKLQTSVLMLIQA